VEVQSVDGIVAVSHGTKTTASSNFKGLGKRDQTKPNQTICRSVAYFNLRPNPLGPKSPSLLCESALAPITFRFIHSRTSTLHRSLSAPFLHQVHPPPSTASATPLLVLYRRCDELERLFPRGRESTFPATCPSRTAHG
jgi:hypothetical protein